MSDHVRGFIHGVLDGPPRVRLERSPVRLHHRQVLGPGDPLRRSHLPRAQGHPWLLHRLLQVQRRRLRQVGVQRQILGEGAQVCLRRTGNNHLID